MCFPGGSVVKNPPANAGDVGSIPGSERSPGEGNGNPLQYYRISWTEEAGRLQSMGLRNTSDRSQWLNKNNKELKCLKEFKDFVNTKTKEKSDVNDKCQ